MSKETKSISITSTTQSIIEGAIYGKNFSNNIDMIAYDYDVMFNSTKEEVIGIFKSYIEMKSSEEDGRRFLENLANSCNMMMPNKVVKVTALIHTMYNMYITASNAKTVDGEASIISSLTQAQALVLVRLLEDSIAKDIHPYDYIMNYKK